MSNPFSKEEKKFSICTPCYGDTARHIEKFAEIMDAQDYKNFEWILTFDGPNKKGEKLMEKVKKKYPKMDISWHTIKHAGACAARNNSAKYATGEYYVFTSPDCWLYPETLRIWANAFDEHPEVNRVWGLYDILNNDGSVLSQIGQVPYLDGKVWYEAFKYSPYADATFPVRKEAFIDWDVNCKSLNDWEWSIRLLQKTDFRGDDHLYIPQSFFIAEAPQPKGLSNDSHTNWQERKKYIQEKNGIQEKDIVVTSLGAPNHAIPVSKMLDAEYLTMPSFKDHNYKMVYLLGFYTREDPQRPGFVTRSHMDVFRGNKGLNIIHWIGTDIWDLRRHNSFDKLKELRQWFKDNNIIHLCEADFTQKELKELGIDAKIVPIPPKKVFKPLPLPEEFSVGVYLPGRDIYSENHVMDITRSMPDVKFYFFGNNARKGEKGDNWEHLGYIDFEEWMPKFSANLRITTHDGLPLTPVQFMTAGRNVVTNVPMKGAIHLTWESKDGTNNLREKSVEAIRKAQAKPLSKKWSDYWIKEMNTEKYVKSIRGLK